MDQLPLDGRITDLRAFARLGEEGVDLFMVDSTNAEVPGFTTPEVRSARCSTGCSTAASGASSSPASPATCTACSRCSTPRSRTAARSPTSAARWSATWGSPATSATSTCRRACWSTPSELGDYPPEQMVLVSTGSQGEPLSALSRIAQRNHNFVHIERGRHRRPRVVADPGQRERRLPGDQRAARAGARTSSTRATPWSTSAGTPSPVSCSTATTSSGRAT